jgi:hypothetical protein
VVIKREPAPPFFNAGLFTLAKLWKQLRCPTTDKRIMKWVINPQWNFTQPEEE